jgi:hypothetical protein
MDPDHDRLREVLRDETARLCHDAVQGGGAVSAERIEALARLDQLVEIEAKLEPTPSRNRWATPVLLAITLAVVSVLLFARVNRTEIEFDARLREVGFRLATDDVLIESAEITTLTVAGARAVSVRSAGTWPGLDLTDSEGEGLNVEMSLGPDGRITMAPIEAKAGTRVWLRPTDEPGRFHLTLSGSDVEIRASLHGGVRIAAPEAGTEMVAFPFPRPAVFHSSDTTIDLDITLLRPDAVSFSPQLAVKSLSLYEVHHSNGSDRPFSSVVSGAVYLEALDGQKLDLRSRQELRLADPRGRIRTIRLEPGAVALQFHGSVEAMETGSVDAPRSLMPTYLEWLQARHGLSLLWGTAIYLFGLVSAALRWFKVRI